LIALACPFCGARLVSKTADYPPRLACSNCGRVLPQPPSPTLLGWLDRHWAGLLVLVLLLVMPFSLLVVAPFLEGAVERRQPRLETRVKSGHAPSEQHHQPASAVRSPVHRRMREMP